MSGAAAATAAAAAAEAATAAAAAAVTDNRAHLCTCSPHRRQQMTALYPPQQLLQARPAAPACAPAACGPAGPGKPPRCSGSRAEQPIQSPAANSPPQSMEEARKGTDQNHPQQRQLQHSSGSPPCTEPEGRCIKRCQANQPAAEAHIHAPSTTVCKQVKRKRP